MPKANGNNVIQIANQASALTKENHESMSAARKWIYVALAVTVTGYLADAIYPQWDWSCTAQGELYGLPSIPQVKDDPQLGGPFRHASLTIPKGCIATPRNMLRRAVEWLGK